MHIHARVIADHLQDDAGYTWFRICTLSLADAPATPAGVRLTPDAAVGLLVGIAFVAVSLLGLTCIGAVQTPSRFATAHPPSTKEF